jgi:hypothetical protein
LCTLRCVRVFLSLLLYCARAWIRPVPRWTRSDQMALSSIAFVSLLRISCMCQSPVYTEQPLKVCMQHFALSAAAPVCLPACLPACHRLPDCLPVCLRLPVCLPDCLTACLACPVCLSTFSGRATASVTVWRSPPAPPRKPGYTTHSDPHQLCPRARSQARRWLLRKRRQQAARLWWRRGGARRLVSPRQSHATPRRTQLLL